MTNLPREGKRPTLPAHPEDDAPDTQHSLVRKVDSGLAEVKRDSMRNRFMAKSQGWSDAQYQHWVETGVAPCIYEVELTPEQERYAAEVFNAGFDEKIHR